ncbi:hypothetical protein MKX01_042847 [Papaver californicum]|nr:hypothetical protein MKX01_042847 [Papaver californicum]
MRKSHVCKGFWLNLSVEFCRSAKLPKDLSTKFTLVSKAGIKCKVKYIARRNGLSGGWRGFAMKHELDEGDAIVFHLVEATVTKEFQNNSRRWSLDSKIPEDDRASYYELCRSQKALLHKNVVQKSDPELLAAMVSEIVNTADAIRACKLTTPMDELEAWERSLRAIKRMGFNVEFLISRLEIVMKMQRSFDPEQESEKYQEAVMKHGNIKLEIQDIERNMFRVTNVRERAMEMNE